MSEYINEKRMTDEFLQLACIDSVSFGERQIADILKAKLEELGFIVHEDDGTYQVKCWWDYSCRHHTAHYPTEEQAIAEWNNNNPMPNSL